jgi:hypothetical protein
MLNEVTRDKLVELFWEGISDTSWDVWCDTSSTDKERIAVEAIVKLDDPTVDTEEVFELFWEWADGLEEDSFFDFDSLKN